MNRSCRPVFAVLLACSLGCPSAFLVPEPAIPFLDVSESWDLLARTRGMMNHAAACEDIDGDGDLDLYFGNFCDRAPELYKGADGPVSNFILRNDRGTLVNASQNAVSWKGRTSGVVFADFDNDGDPDLYVSNNSVRAIFMPNRLLENVNGQFRDVSEGNGACIQMGGRSVAALDYNGDGRLDILAAEDVPGRTRLFRNKGGLQFEDATAEAGLPDSLPGMGVITPDLNLDGWPDIFVSGANALLLSRGDGTYREAPEANPVLKYSIPEGFPCGVGLGDVDRDGDLDIFIADHAKRPGARQHLFLNQGLKDGVPVFRDASVQAGFDYVFPNVSSRGFLVKSAHAEIVDFDNDGWPDIYVAATYEENGRDLPFVARNLGKGPDGTVRFQIPPVNKVNAYFPAGPAADYDHDGRVDILLASWFPEIPSRLYLNRSTGHHWIDVRVRGKTINRAGIGCRVRVSLPGKLGDSSALLGYDEIAVTKGYCTSGPPVAHFGLGAASKCDVEVILPFGKGIITRKDVPADQSILIEQE